MNVEPFKFDIRTFQDDDLEEICYKIVLSMGFEKVEWFKGPGDRGRDILAWKRFQISPGEFELKRYIFEIKGQKNSLSIGDISQSLSWADAYHSEDKLDYFMIMTTSSLRPNTRDHIEKINTGRKFRIIYYEGHWINEYVKYNPHCISDLFISQYTLESQKVLRLVDDPELSLGSEIVLIDVGGSVIGKTKVTSIFASPKVHGRIYTNQIIAMPKLDINRPASILNSNDQTVGFFWAGSKNLMLIHPFFRDL